MGDSTVILTPKKCDFCGGTASYDAKTLMGPWANMCEAHWRTHGIGRLGTGYGQRLILRTSGEAR